MITPTVVVQAKVENDEQGDTIQELERQSPRKVVKHIQAEVMQEEQREDGIELARHTTVIGPKDVREACRQVRARQQYHAARGTGERT